MWNEWISILEIEYTEWKLFLEMFINIFFNLNLFTYF